MPDHAAIRLNQPLPQLGKVRSTAALTTAFDPQFAGDRAGTLVFGLGSMLVDVYGGRTELYLVHGLNAQQLANAAYNVEVASWLLGRRQNADGSPMLLANEINPQQRNLSFEREMSKIMARLELLAEVSDEKIRRSAIDLANPAGCPAAAVHPGTGRHISSPRALKPHMQKPAAICLRA
jgi:hypothetical protein